MNFFTTNKKLLTIVAACIVGLGLLFYLLFYIDSCGFNRGINTDKNAINTLTNQIPQINANIANLDQQSAIKRTEINAQANEKAKITTKRHEAEVATNNSLANVSTVSNSNFSNTSTNDFYNALCDAYPNAPDCKH